MFGSKLHRSIVAPLLLGGMLLTWEGLWRGLTDWLWGSSKSVVTMSDYSSGIDPDGRPTNTSTGSADSKYSSGIDPLGRPTGTSTGSADSEYSSGIDPNGRP